MGAVDLVIQVAAPDSVASGLQRIGRAGHQVGAPSVGKLFPRYRGDLLQTAVVAQGMLAADIESTRYPRNPLDVLAQQLVAMVAVDEWHVDDLYAAVRRSAPFAELSHERVPRGARHAGRALPVRRVRGSATPGRLGSGGGHRPRARGRRPDRDHVGRHDPGSRAVRRVHDRRLASRRARRGVCLRVAPRRGLPARGELVADRRDHARPGRRHAGARRARQAPVLESAGARAPGRARSQDGPVHPRARLEGPRRRRRDARAGPAARSRSPRRTSSRMSRTRPKRPRSPTIARSWSSASGTSSATGGSAC